MNKDQETKYNSAVLYEIIENLPGHVYWKDTEGVYLGCNNRQAKSLGLQSGKEIIGKTDAELHWGEEAVACFRQNDIDVMTSQVSKIVEEPAVVDGREAIVLSCKAPLKNENGEIIGVLGMSIDITDRKRLEEELKVAKAKAEEASAAKSQFLRIMSHELRTPISNIISGADFIRPEKEPDPELHAEMIAMIDDQARSVLSILEHACHYIELDASTLEQQTTRVDIRSLLNRLEEQYKHRCRDGVSFATELLYPKMTFVEFDVMNAVQVLDIVIENALKFTQKGSVRLVVDLLPPNVLRLTVRDTGPGISKEQLENIFATFLSPDQLSEKSAYIKTGLKLPLARRIAELIGGGLDVESTRGEGTVIHIDIPYVSIKFSQGMPAEASPAKLPELSLPDDEEIDIALDQLALNVLLVEDDPTNAQLHARMLKTFGCDVIIAANAEQAIRAVKNNAFDLVLLDISLPDDNGVSVARTIKPLLTKNAHIIALTSHSTPDDEDHFLTQGMSAVLPKPMTERGLKEFLMVYVESLNQQAG